MACLEKKAPCCAVPSYSSSSSGIVSSLLSTSCSVSSAPVEESGLVIGCDDALSLVPLCAAGGLEEGRSGYMHSRLPFLHPEHHISSVPSTSEGQHQPCLTLANRSRFVALPPRISCKPSRRQDRRLGHTLTLRLLHMKHPDLVRRCFTVSRPPLVDFLLLRWDED